MARAELSGSFLRKELPDRAEDRSEDKKRTDAPILRCLRHHPLAGH